MPWSPRNAVASPTRLVLHRVELPLARHALQRMHAAVGERDSRAGDEVRDGPRDEHLPRPGDRSHARADVDRDAPEVVAYQLALAGMEPGPHLDPEVAHRIAGRAGAADRARGAVDGGQEPVAERLHLPAPLSLELAADERIV